jgi:hypothetical protein
MFVIRSGRTLTSGRVGSSGGESLVGTCVTLVGARVSESLKVGDTSSVRVSVGSIARSTVVDVGEVVLGA